MIENIHRPVTVWRRRALSIGAEVRVDDRGRVTVEEIPDLRNAHPIGTRQSVELQRGGQVTGKRGGIRVWACAGHIGEALHDRQRRLVPDRFEERDVGWRHRSHALGER